jgi:hypothetical protein
MKNGEMSDVGRNLKNGSTTELGRSLQSSPTSALDVIQMMSLPTDVGHNPQSRSHTTLDFLREGSSKVSDVGPERRGVASASTLDVLRMKPDPLRQTRSMSELPRLSSETSEFGQIQESSLEALKNAKKMRAERRASSGAKRQELYSSPSTLDFYGIQTVDRSRLSLNLDVPPITTELSSASVPIETTSYHRILRVQDLVKETLGDLPVEPTEKTWQERTWKENFAKVGEWTFSHPEHSENQRLYDYLTKVDEILQKGVDDFRPHQAEGNEKTWSDTLYTMEYALRRASQTKAGDVAFSLGIAAVNNVLASAIAKQWLWAGLGGGFAAAYLANGAAGWVAKRTNGDIKPYAVAVQTLVGQAVTVAIVLGSRKGS